MNTKQTRIKETKVQQGTSDRENGLYYSTILFTVMLPKLKML